MTQQQGAERAVLHAVQANSALSGLGQIRANSFPEESAEGHSGLKQDSG